MWRMKSMKSDTPFNWTEAILSILLLISGIAIIGTAKDNWILAVGVLLMMCGAVESEKNRRRNER